MDFLRGLIVSVVVVVMEGEVEGKKNNERREEIETDCCLSLELEGGLCRRNGDVKWRQNGNEETELTV